MPNNIGNPRSSRSSTPERREQMFSDCVAAEKQLTKNGVEKELAHRLKENLFIHHPLFVGELPPYGPLLKEIERRYPFDFSIARTETTRVPEAEFRCAQIRRYVKSLDKPELRLLCIARWLKQEGICEPEEILSRSLLQRLLKQFAKKERISKTDVFYSRVITIWRPYFEQLRASDRELGERNRGNTEELLKQGYDLEAINIALANGSLVATIANWIELRIGVDARTLENAHARLNAARRQKTTMKPHTHHNFCHHEPVK